MIIFRARVICDMCTNSLDFLEIDHPYTIKEIKSHVADAGWMVRKTTNRTLCPTCRKKVE